MDGKEEEKLSSDPCTFSVNSIDTREEFKQYFLRNNGSDYFLQVLGKAGEPIVSLLLHIELFCSFILTRKTK